MEDGHSREFFIACHESWPNWEGNAWGIHEQDLQFWIIQMMDAYLTSQANSNYDQAHKRKGGKPKHRFKPEVGDTYGRMFMPYRLQIRLQKREEALNQKSVNTEQAFEDAIARIAEESAGTRVN